MALVEIVGVASIMPFLAVLADPTVVHSNPVLSELYSRLGFADTQRFLFFLGVMVFSILICSLLFKAVATYAQLRFVLMQEYTIGNRLVDTYLHQPYSWFLNQNSADLAKNILSEVNQIIQQAMMPMMVLISQGVGAIAIIILLLVVEPGITSVTAVILVACYGLIYTIASRFLSRIGEERIEANQARFTAVNEAIGAIKELKLNGLESVYVEKYGRWAEIHARHQTSNQIVSNLPRYILEAIAFGGMLLVILYLMHDQKNFSEVLPIVGLFAFAGYRLLPSLQQIYASVSQLRYIAPALSTLHSNLELVSEKSVDGDGSQSPLKFHKSIRLDQLSYSYPGSSKTAITDFNLELHPHKIYGIVGQTGSGKSTLVDIILALLEPQSGQFLVDGTKISGKNRHAWQECVGYVPQQIYLSDDTISANIALGRTPEDISQNGIIRAAKIANLHEFVSSQLPDGYDTKVGERGIRLSGGQRQRIGIARAIYKNPRILVLDEATSALDNLTERAVMHAIQSLGSEITIILVAHRLSTVKNCDRIFMIDAGRITASGAYEELLEDNERFRELAGAVEVMAQDKIN